MRNKLEVFKRLEGLQTVETVMRILDIKRQSAVNLLSRLNREGHIQKQGGSYQKRLYRISPRMIRKEREGMFDMINKHSRMKIRPLFSHVPHAAYRVEDALIDAIKTGDFRTVLASLSLFNHIGNWPYLYSKAKKYRLRKDIIFLYDIARSAIRVRRIPKKTGQTLLRSKDRRTISFRYAKSDLEALK